MRPSTRAAGLLLVIVAMALALSSSRVHGALVAAVRFVEPVITAHPVAGIIVFAALAVLSSMLVFVSSVILVPVGVGLWGEMVCVLVLWASWFVGGLLTYSIGRHLGRRVVRWFVSDEKLESFERRIPRDGAFLTALAIQASFPSDIAGYAFGLVNFPRRTFLAALAVAELPYAIGTVYVGEAFLEQNYLLLGGTVIAMVALVAWERWREAKRTKPAAA